MNIGVIGLPGTGKTIFMTYAALRYDNNGFDIYSNYNIFVNGKPKSKRILSRQDLDKTHRGHVFLDELPTWLDSRFSMSDQNTFVNAVLQKNRKREISLMWSAQSFGMADIRLRMNTNYLIFPAVYYTEDGEEGSKEFKIEQDFFNPVDMKQYLPFARVRACLIPSWMYEYIDDIQDKHILKWFDFPMAPFAECYDTSEEVKGLIKSEEQKGELIEESHKIALEEFYNVPVVRNKNSGRGLDSKDLELTVNNELMIIDSTSIQITKDDRYKRKYSYINFKNKLPLTQYQELEKSRNCKTYFMYEDPKGSGNMFLYPTAFLWGHKKNTISTKKLESQRIKIK